jgi:cyclase
VAAVHACTRCPVIVSGGYGEPAHLEALLGRVRPSAVAFASALHYRKATAVQLRALMPESLP